MTALNSGYIYLFNLPGTDVHKIGVSHRPTRRLSGVRRSSEVCRDAVLVGSHLMRDPYACERLWHLFFSPQRRTFEGMRDGFTEWFLLEPGMVELFWLCSTYLAALENNVTKEEAAQHLGMSVRTLQRLTADGLFHPVNTGSKGVAVYDQTELDWWQGLSEDERKEVRKQAAPVNRQLVTTENTVTTAVPRDIASRVQAEEFVEQVANSVAAVLSRIDTRPLWLTYEDAVRASGLPPTWIKDAVRAGLVGTIGTGRSLRVNRESLLAFTASDGLHTFVESRREQRKKRATAKP